jgi:hypothetical protein
VRPLSRLALMIARPARVRMRARKPCLRARRRVFGWNVRFTEISTLSTCPKCRGVFDERPGAASDDPAARRERRRRSLNASRLEPTGFVRQPPASVRRYRK